MRSNQHLQSITEQAMDKGALSNMKIILIIGLGLLLLITFVIMYVGETKLKK